MFSCLGKYMFNSCCLFHFRYCMDYTLRKKVQEERNTTSHGQCNWVFFIVEPPCVKICIFFVQVVIVEKFSPVNVLAVAGQSVVPNQNQKCQTLQKGPKSAWTKTLRKMSIKKLICILSLNFANDWMSLLSLTVSHLNCEQWFSSKRRLKKIFCRSQLLFC